MNPLLADKTSLRARAVFKTSGAFRFSCVCCSVIIRVNANNGVFMASMWFYARESNLSFDAEIYFDVDIHRSKTMTDCSKKCFDDDKLNDFAEVITTRIVSNKSNMPFLRAHYIERNDVWIEVCVAFLNLARTFKEKKGGMSFSSYCYALGEITAWRNIKRRFASKARFIPFQNMDYRIGHLYGWADGLSETVEDARPSIEQADLINVLYGLGDETDREIMRYMLCGHGIRDIERKNGMSHQAICKRLKQLGMRFMELE